jgi:hypothetical protein
VREPVLQEGSNEPVYRGSGISDNDPLVGGRILEGASIEQQCPVTDRRDRLPVTVGFVDKMDR